MLNKDKKERKTIFLGIRIPEKLHNYLQKRARQEGLSLSQYVRNILADQFFMDWTTRTQEGIDSYIQEKIDKDDTLKQHFADFEEAMDRGDATHPMFALALERTADKFSELVEMQRNALKEMEDRLIRLKRIEEQYKQEKKKFHEKWTDQIRKELKKGEEKK